MTKGIEEMLGLPSMDDPRTQRADIDETIDVPETDEEGIDEQDPALVAQQIVARMKDAESRLAQVDGRDHAEAMDQLYKEIAGHARNLVDLGFNIDPARSARMFEVAAAFYGKAIDAKNSKRDAQLKAMRLALDQRKLELDEMKAKREAGEEGEPAEGTHMIEDRNELIRLMHERLKGAQPGTPTP